jgi:hypothetical protein
VFTSLDYQSPGFDWSILRVALETVEHLMGRIDQASEEQYSSEFSDNVDAPFAEEAVMVRLAPLSYVNRANHNNSAGE